MRVEDKVTKTDNKRVTNECLGQVELNPGGDPLKDCMKHASEHSHQCKEAGHISANSQPSLFAKCLCSVNSQHM